MLNDYLQAYTLSIVLVGDFNPVIIQPFWLVSKKLIGETEGKAANVDIIHNDLVRYSFDWVKLEITKDKFSLTSSQEPYFESVKDLAINIFQNLPETPITALGINHIKHFSMPNKEVYYDVGNRLAPLKNWSDFMSDPRLLVLEILDQKPRKGNISGYYRISVSPSDIVPLELNGISIRINDHYALEGEQGRNGQMIRILGNAWAPLILFYNEMLEKLWKNIS